VSTTNDLLSNYQNVIDSLTLVTGDKGVFDVTVDGKVLYSKGRAGRHAEPGEVLELFTQHVGPDVPRYPRD
jgi:selenoprotein W-related protein